MVINPSIELMILLLKYHNAKYFHVKLFHVLLVWLTLLLIITNFAIQFDCIFSDNSTLMDEMTDDSRTAHSDSYQKNSNAETAKKDSHKRRYIRHSNLVKKRQFNTKKLISEQKKFAVNHGTEFIDKEVVIVKERSLKPPCDKSCRFKCSFKIQESFRQEMFKKFWALGSHYKQWNYLSKILKIKTLESNSNSEKSISENSVTEMERDLVNLPVSNTSFSSVDSHGNSSSIQIGTKAVKRQHSIHYFFNINNTEIKVCKTMFLATFDISDSYIKTISKKTGSNNLDISPDKRGKHAKRGNIIPLETKTSVIEHMNIFPRVESHYLRQRTQREFSDENLSVHKMWELYKLWVVETHPNLN